MEERHTLVTGSPRLLLMAAMASCSLVKTRAGPVCDVFSLPESVSKSADRTVTALVLVRCASRAIDQTRHALLCRSPTGKRSISCSGTRG